MAIANIEQPELIELSDCLRLRKFEGLGGGLEDISLSWYQDRETVRLVDGPEAEPYSRERLYGMYGYLAGKGELYWIEERSGGGFVPIGDVSLLPDGDTPIVIGEPAGRGRGVGRQAIAALINRAEALGFPRMTVSEIYSFNTGSQRLFGSLGYVKGGPTANGHKYVLEMSRKLYAAYGSNMNIEQMRLRCPGAKPVGAGVLRGYRLLFRAGGKGVYLTVEPEESMETPVALWEIGPGSELALDEYEVYPSLYFKETLKVYYAEKPGRPQHMEPALVYIMCDGHEIAAPGSEYVKACAAGYMAFDLDAAPLYEAERYSASKAQAKA